MYTLPYLQMENQSADLILISSILSSQKSYEVG